MALYTCLTCRVAFTDPDRQRDHYKTDWHRYNLKRKVAEMPPVTAEVFKEKVLSRQAQLQEDEKQPTDLYCLICNKHFRSQNALESHMRSKKHLEIKAKATSRGIITESELVTKASCKQSKENAESSEEDSDVDSWDGTESMGIEECLFCSHVSSSLETNMEHMTVKHSFFLPDAEYISDLEGLIVYLGEKICQGHMCLWCNERSKMFYNTKDVQKHMIDKGHCKMKHDDQVMFEYADFYDYRSSYPDADQKAAAGEGEEAAPTLKPQELIDDGYELVLPSGSTIGHRSLARYYNQNLPPKRKEVKSILPKVLAKYKALGWTGSTGGQVEQRARDFHFLQRLKNKHHMQLGLKANRLQTHFRDQNA